MKTIKSIGLTILFGLVLLGFHFTKTQAQVANSGRDKAYDETKLSKATFAGGCFGARNQILKKSRAWLKRYPDIRGERKKIPLMRKYPRE